MFASGDNLSAVVCDVGSYSFKAGFAGEDSPAVQIPSMVGLIPEDKVTDKGSKYQITMENLNLHKGLELKSPLEDGLVADWDIVQSLWDYSNETLSVNSSEHPVLLAEPAFNSQTLREQYTTMMFENYKVPAVFLCKSAVLSCFANGRATGLVVELGAGTTTTVPVHEGFVLQKAVNRSPVAGNFLSQQFQAKFETRLSGKPLLPASQISKKRNAKGALKVETLNVDSYHPSYNSFMKLTLVDDIKHVVGRVSETAYDATANVNIPTVPYELPDGIQLQVGPERFGVPEFLMDPSLVEKEFSSPPDSLPKMICDSVLACELEARKDLFSNLIITGGGSLFEGTMERIEKDVIAMAPPLMFKVRKVAAGPLERKIGAWLGGSILGSLGSFHEMWVSKAEYEEHGAGIVERKCP